MCVLAVCECVFTVRESECVSFYISVLRLTGATKGVQSSCGAVTWCWACAWQSPCFCVCVSVCE